MFFNFFKTQIPKCIEIKFFTCKCWFLNGTCRTFFNKIEKAYSDLQSIEINLKYLFRASSLLLRKWKGPFENKILWNRKLFIPIRTDKKISEVFKLIRYFWKWFAYPTGLVQYLPGQLEFFPTVIHLFAPHPLIVLMLLGFQSQVASGFGFVIQGSYPHWEATLLKCRCPLRIAISTERIAAHSPLAADFE